MLVSLKKELRQQQVRGANFYVRSISYLSNSRSRSSSSSSSGNATQITKPTLNMTIYAIVVF
jgi:hypothetical protein